MAAVETEGRVAERIAGRRWKWIAPALAGLALFLLPTFPPVFDSLEVTQQDSTNGNRETLFVVTEVANVRATASVDSEIVGKVTRNSEVTGLSRDGGWVKVIIPGTKNLVGWIHSSLLTRNLPSAR